MNIEQENTCNNKLNNEFVGEQTIACIDYTLQQSKLVGVSTVSLIVATPIDQTTKHYLLTNNGHDMVIVEDIGNLVCM